MLGSLKTSRFMALTLVIITAAGCGNSISQTPHPDEIEPVASPNPSPGIAENEAPVADDEEDSLEAGIPVVAWFGYVVSTSDGAEFDDFVTIFPEGQVGEFGIEGANEAVEAEISALRDHEEPGKYANFWGTLTCDVIDYGGCQLLVDRIRSGIETTEPEPFEGWEGTIVGFSYDEPGAPQPDDAFMLAGEYPVQYGIASYIAENGWPIFKEELENLRDTEQTIRISGHLICGFPDMNSCQIQVNQIEIDGIIVDAYQDWQTYTDDEYGFSFRYPGSWQIVQEQDVPFISFENGNFMFIIGVRHSTEDIDLIINRTESLEQMGMVNFLGQEIPRMAWLKNNRVLAVRYGEPENFLDGGVIKVDPLVFTISLWEFGDDWPNTANISMEVQIEVDQMISSFKLTE